MILKEKIANISKAITENKLVIFVGAGVSKNYGYPDWNKLTDEIIKIIGLPKHEKLKNDLLKCSDLSSKNKLDIEKIINEHSFATDEYLLFAQYLFEKLQKQYDKPEYKFKVIIERILNKPNHIKKKYKIIEKIFALNPQHIITTNYDNLLDKYKKNQYGIIAKDEDLAKTDKNNYIVKMHGDFENNNFVLKEDDYHSYRENFKLIDNFVKSVFATHTLLFIGFAANDPNFKQIYAWIGRILKEYTRKAFYLNLKKEDFNNLKRNYFENKNIHIIDYEDISDYHNKNKIEDWGKRLEFCLDNLNFNIVDQLVYKLQPLEETIYPEIWGIKQILLKFGIIVEMNHVTIKNTVLKNYIDGLNNIKNDRIFILFVIVKNFFNSNKVTIKTNRNYKLCDYFQDFSNEVDTKLDLFTEFKFKELQDKIEPDISVINFKNNKRTELNAFLLFMMSEREKAENIYLKLMDFYEQEGNFLKFFQIGYNLQHIDYEFFDFKKGKKKLTINIYQNINEYLTFFENKKYLKKFIDSSYNKIIEVSDLKKQFENNSVSGRLNFKSFLNDMNHLFLLLAKESIIPNYKIDLIFKNYLQAYFISYFTKINNKSLLKNNFPIAKIEELEFNYLFYSIIFIKSKELRIMIQSEYNKKTENDFLKNELITCLKSLNNSIPSNIKLLESNYYIERIVNFLLILNLFKLNKNDIVKILNLITKNIFKFETINYLKYLKFFFDQNEVVINSIDINEIRFFLKELADSFKHFHNLNNVSGFTTIIENLKNNKLTSTLRLNNPGIKNIFKLINYTKRFLEKCIGISILINMSHFCSIELKKKILSYTLDFFIKNLKSNDEKKQIRYFYANIIKLLEISTRINFTNLDEIKNALLNNHCTLEKSKTLYLDAIYHFKLKNIITQKEINDNLQSFITYSIFYDIVLFERDFRPSIEHLEAKWFLHLIDNKERLNEILNKYQIDRKKIILKINSEILKGSLKEKEQFQKLTNLLLDEI